MWTWNFESGIIRSRSLKVGRELAKSTLNLAGIKEARWGKCNESADNFTFLCKSDNLG
jgi:hypothetical protein